MASPVCEQPGETKPVLFHVSRPGGVFRVSPPPTRPSRLYLVEPGLQGGLLLSPEAFSAIVAGDGLAGPTGAEGTELHSGLRDEPLRA